MRFQTQYDRSPNGPEIADEFGYRTPNTAYQHLRSIARKGYIELIQSGTRKPLRITVTDKAQRRYGSSWAVLGRIPAGPIDERSSQVEERLSSLEDLLPMIRPGDFFLTVEGDSMRNAGLEEGMRVLMRPAEDIQQGDICAVHVRGDGGTLKRVYIDGAAVQLVPENEAYSPVVVQRDRVDIQGVLVAVVDVREYRKGQLR